MFYPAEHRYGRSGLRSLALAALLLAILSVIAAAAAAVGLGPSPTPEEARRLAAGEVLAEVAEPAGGGPGEGVGRGVIDAPPERVFAALSDFAHYPEWMPFVQRSDARPEADGTVLSTQALHLPARIGDRRYRIRAVSMGPGVPGAATGGRVWSLRWTYVPGSGDVVDTRGSWTVVEMGGGGGTGGNAGRRSLATCRMFLDPGGVSGWTMNRAMEKNLLWVFQGLRQQVLRGRYLKY